MGGARREAAFEKLLKELEPALRRIREGYRIDAETGRDLLQETFLRYLRHEERIHSPKAWLATAYRHECVDWIAERARSREGHLELARAEEHRSREPAASREVLLNEVLASIQGFDGQTKIALEGRYLEELPAPTLAEQLGVTVSSVKNVVSRQLKRVRRKLRIRKTPR